MRFRDPFSGKFTTRAKYARAVKRLTRLREKAFARDDDLELARLTSKARRYPPPESTRRPRRETPERIAGEMRRAARAVGQTDWEFGLEYESRQGANHDVGVNVRLTFDRRVSEAQARLALEILVAGGDMDGVEVNAVDWARPGKRIKEGDSSDLASFADVIATVGVRNLRAGGVKLDEL